MTDHPKALGESWESGKYDPSKEAMRLCLLLGGAEVGINALEASRLPLCELMQWLEVASEVVEKRNKDSQEHTKAGAQWQQATIPSSLRRYV